MTMKFTIKATSNGGSWIGAIGRARSTEITACKAAVSKLFDISLFAHYAEFHITNRKPRQRDYHKLVLIRGTYRTVDLIKYQDPEGLTTWVSDAIKRKFKRGKEKWDVIYVSVYGY